LFFEVPSSHLGLIFRIFGSTLEVFGMAPCQLFELFPLGQQLHLTIRSMDLDPSNYFLRASSAVLLFELWVPLGQQRRLIIRVVDSGPSNHFFSTSSAAILFK
jgi:hypothetical protein